MVFAYAKTTPSPSGAELQVKQMLEGRAIAREINMNRSNEMNLFEKLKQNKGTVSSALGKELAKEVLDGNLDLLKEAVPLVCYNLKIIKDKNIRSGAAKIVEIVAEKKPELVAKYLFELLPSLEAAEPQTRWMTFRTIGFCSSLKPEIAKKALPFAKKYINEKTDGQLCLVGAADMYLGDYGNCSKQNAEEAYSILIDSTNNVIMNEHDWIMEAFMKIAKYLNEKQKETILEFCEEYKDYPRKATQVRIKKLKEMCQK